MRGAKNDLEEGFSTRAKNYFRKGSLFSKDKTFDGELKSLRRVVRKNAEDSESKKHYSYHTFVIKKGGKEMTYVFKGHPDMDFTQYFKKGELVRHHAGYEIPEKYDKTEDDEILCIICGEFSPVDKNQCPYCGGVLLK